MMSSTNQPSARCVDLCRKRRRSGFTLVEVLATVTILAIIAFAAIPLLSGRGDVEAQG